MPWFQSNSNGLSVWIARFSIVHMLLPDVSAANRTAGGVFPVDRSAALYCTERELPPEIARTDQYELSYMML